MSEGRDQGSGLERVPTGVHGLDEVLKGGLLRGGVYIVHGPSGVGKTVLGNQLCFHHVERGGKALYVTLLAEAHSRMLQHLSPMAFFKPEVIPERLYYMSGFRLLEEESLPGLLQLLRREMVAYGASMLILDSLVAVEESAGTTRAFKKFIHELQVHSAMTGCIVVLLANPSATARERPEHTMVDGVIELGEDTDAYRSERMLSVTKLRGGPSLRGRHSFSISEKGLLVHPRLEARFKRPSTEDKYAGKSTSTGVPALDRMLGGSIGVGTMTALLGSSGSGKTSLGLSFLNGSSREEPGMLFSFFETPPRILEQSSNTGLQLRRLVDEGQLEMVWQAATEHRLDALAQRLLDRVEARGVRRLFIDGLEGFEASALHPERMRTFFTALGNELRVRGVTTLYSVEIPQLFGPSIDAPFQGMSAIVENLILLRLVELESRLIPVISIAKTRDGERDSTLRKLYISGEGIGLSEPLEEVEGLLTGYARRPAKAPAPRGGASKRETRR